MIFASLLETLFSNLILRTERTSYARDVIYEYRQSILYIVVKRK